MESIAHTILAVNAGSSSLKASLFSKDGTRHNYRYTISSHGEASIETAFKELFAVLRGIEPDVITHRFVHGGDVPETYRLLSRQELVRLQEITTLAPLHLPANLLGADLCSAQFNCPQIACFDTAFHHTLPEIAKRLPIPAKEKIRRYGFHGLSYAYLASQLPALIGEKAKGNVIFAHLGAGASLCLTKNLLSVDTTMGYSPCGGIPMATRSGDMDPGVIIELSNRYDHQTLFHMINHDMGLIALSDGEGGDMAKLIDSNSESAKFAVDFFCYEVSAAIGSLAAKAGGIDALVFSGGIGEHSSHVRAKVCQPLGFLNLKIDFDANRENSTLISSSDSLPILCIPTDEEAIMRDYAEAYLQ